MIRGALAGLLLLVAADGQASEMRGEPGFALAKPKSEGLGGIALAILDLDPAGDLAFGYDCPPMPEEPKRDGTDTICMFDQSGSVRRVLVATPDFGANSHGKFQMLGRHVRAAIRGGSYIALIEQTSNGYTWVTWRAPLIRGQACLSIGLMIHYSIRVPADATTEKNGERCFEASRSF